jgi:hypothetical protein
VNSGHQHNLPIENSFFVWWNIEINSSDGPESDYSLRSAQSLELNKFNSNDNLPQVLASCVASFKFELEPADFDWQHFLSSFPRRLHKKDRTIASKVTMS